MRVSELLTATFFVIFLATVVVDSMLGTVWLTGFVMTDEQVLWWLKGDTVALVGSALATIGAGICMQ